MNGGEQARLCMDRGFGPIDLSAWVPRVAQARGRMPRDSLSCPFAVNKAVACRPAIQAALRPHYGQLAALVAMLGVCRFRASARMVENPPKQNSPQIISPTSQTVIPPIPQIICPHFLTDQQRGVV